MNLVLALLETAPDRRTAEAMLVAAVTSGVDGNQMKRSWRRWQRNHAQSVLRGEAA